MLRWMAPFLSFTAEEAWGVLGLGNTIFKDRYVQLPAPDTALLDKWSRIREIREQVNKDIEVVRGQGLVGSPLQAHIQIECNPQDLALLETLETDLKFIFITSKVELISGTNLVVHVSTAWVTKCERCWHYPDYPSHVGSDTSHPTICPRCVSNLHGSGEQRAFA
jgi:isoleucyl-tRNA synthetase